MLQEVGDEGHSSGEKKKATLHAMQGLKIDEKNSWN